MRGVSEGWRYVFVIAALMSAAFIPMTQRVGAGDTAEAKLSYREAMESLWMLFRTQPLLRESCVVGALVFASFSCFWTTLAFLLSSRYMLGPDVAGSFGLVGAAGAMIAPMAGKWADRRGVRWVLTVGICALAVSFVLLWAGE